MRGGLERRPIVFSCFRFGQRFCDLVSTGTIFLPQFAAFRGGARHFFAHRVGSSRIGFRQNGNMGTQERGFLEFVVDPRRRFDRSSEDTIEEFHRFFSLQPFERHIFCRRGISQLGETF